MSQWSVLELDPGGDPPPRGVSKGSGRTDPRAGRRFLRLQEGSFKQSQNQLYRVREAQNYLCHVPRDPRRTRWVHTELDSEGHGRELFLRRRGTVRVWTLKTRISRIEPSATL